MYLGFLSEFESNKYKIESCNLQKLCFNVIVKNFNSYMCESSPKNVEFLQRRYSQKLMSELRKMYKLDKYNLDFLLNNHLKIVEVDQLRPTLTKEDVREKLIKIGPSITEYYHDWGQCGFEADIAVAVIPHLLNVVKMHLHSCNDTLLELIVGHCPKLIELTVKKSNITGAGLKVLCVHPNLQIPDRCSLACLITPSGIDASFDEIAFLLKNLPTLQELSYKKLPSVLSSIFADGVLEKYSYKFNLTSIDFSYCEDEQVTELIKLCSELCPNVKDLSLPFMTSDMTHLAAFPHLKTIRLNTSEKYLKSQIDFIFLPKLEELIVYNCKITTSSIVANFPNLVSLAISNCMFLVEDVSNGALNTLTNLDVKKIPIESVIGFNFLLSVSPNLKKVSMVQIWHFYFFSSVYRQLLPLEIEVLELIEVTINIDHFYEIIRNCHSLKYLKIHECDNIDYNVIDMIEREIVTSDKSIKMSYLYTDAVQDPCLEF